ncbi:hypothetical protein LY78DRAFT_687193 [Colletotrichum sublineola]|nr:hypothetical protein LY78DRAFT_687193 [Colletotrichum sublineola]
MEAASTATSLTETTTSAETTSSSVDSSTLISATTTSAASSTESSTFVTSTVSTTTTSSVATATPTGGFLRNICLKVVTGPVPGSVVARGPSRFTIKPAGTTAALFNLNLSTGQLYQSAGDQSAGYAVAVPAPYEDDNRPINSFTPREVLVRKLAPIICNVTTQSVTVGVPLSCSATGDDSVNSNTYTRFYYNRNSADSVIRIATDSKSFTRNNQEITLAAYDGDDCN